MDDKLSSQKTAQREKVRESEMAIQHDSNIRMEDYKENNRKFEHLKTFRDENKKVNIKPFIQIQTKHPHENHRLTTGVKSTISSLAILGQIELEEVTITT